MENYTNFNKPVLVLDLDKTLVDVAIFPQNIDED